MTRVQISVVVPAKVYEEIRALRRKFILHTNNNVSHAAVIRLLLHLGLKATQGMSVEELLDVARREGLL